MTKHKIHWLVVIIPTLCLIASGCSITNSGQSAEELVVLGCKDFMSPEGLDYLQQAANLDPEYRQLAVSVSSLQTSKTLIDGGNLDANTKKVIALKMIEDLAVANAYC